MPSSTGFGLRWSRPLSNIYRDEFERVARRAFSMWNRDPASPSFGSFDRQYWGWKYKDFGDATLQYSVRLAADYANTRAAPTLLSVLLEGFVAHCAKIQRRDGSFDQCYPYERTPGVVLDILSTLIYVRQSPHLTSCHARIRLDEAIDRAAAYAVRTDEAHGAIANHFAQYAYELFNYASYSGDPAAKAKAQQYLSRLLDLFDPDEGWFQEYDGPDAGYQTRTLRYLVKIASLNEGPELWSVAERAARFVEVVLMPDGSVHPMLGSRATALLYPSGFEILALRDSRHGPLAARVRQAWQDSRVPLPSVLDFSSAIRLADDAREAAIAAGPGAEKTTMAAPDSLLDADLPKAGIAIRKNGRRACYVGYRLGGVVVAYTRSGDGAWRLAVEDSGYLLQSATGDERWLTRMPGSGTLQAADARRFKIEAHFFRSLHEELSPWRLIALRLLNLTLLRAQRVGDLFRKLVVSRLMAKREPVPVRLRRVVTVGETGIEIVDRVTAGPDTPASAMSGRLYRCRRVTGIHMASARYFQEQEFVPADPGWVEEVAWQGGAAEPTNIRIDATGD